MFSWICPQCGREVQPAYDECPDCAAKTGAGAVTGSAPPPGARGARRPLWATGAQEPLPPGPPPSYAPPPPAPQAYAPPPAYAPPAAAIPPPPAPAAPPEAPPTFRPQPMSPMFQAPPEQAPLYAVPPPNTRPPTWLMVVAIGVIVVLFAGGLYWFFGRAPSTSAVIEAPAAKPGAATENPLQKYIEVEGLRFGPQTKGVQVTFVVINHSDSDIIGLTGTATVLAKTDKAQEEPVGTVDFQTSMPAQSSKELTLPFNTKLKLMEMPDWQNVTVTVKITSPPGA